MKKLTTSVLLCAAAMGLPLTAQALTLSVPTQIQEKNNWCWAATSQMIARFYGRYFVEQCEIAEFARFRNSSTFGNTNCCLNPDSGCNAWNNMYGSNGSIQDILDVHNITASGSSGSLSYADCKTQLDASRPFIIRWSIGHFVVIRGYLDGTPDKLYVIDPWLGEGSKTMNYSDVVSSSGRTWTHTLRTQTPSAANDKVTLYQNDGYGGTAHATSATENYVGDAFNDQTSSAKVRGVPYILYSDINLSGVGTQVTPRDYPNTASWGGANDAVTSVLKMPGANLSTGLVLFDGPNFTGNYTVVSGDNSNLHNSSWGDRVSSIIVVNKIWHLYTDISYGGAPFAVTSFGGPNRDGFYPNPSTWGGPDNDVSSVYWIPESWNPVILYEHADLMGRAVALWPNASSSWRNDFSSLGFNDTVSSIKTYGGTWTMYEHGSQGGASYVLNANTWYRDASSWGGLGDQLSSASYTASGDWF